MAKILAFDRNRRIADGRSRVSMVRSRVAAPFGHIGHAEQAVSDAGVIVSVVVPTRGRPQLLNRCLASLVLQHYDPRHFEIIVVDDEPSDETREIVTGWTAHTEASGPKVIYIPSMGPYGPAAARNHGWRAARGSIIAFTDDDTIASTDWLRHGVRAFDDGADVVCGRLVMPFSGTPDDCELDTARRETGDFVTANCFCLRKVMEDIGGFDERFLFAWREDSDLYFRLLDYHARIVLEPRAVMMHPVRPAPWGFSLRRLKKLQSEALLYKKHPGLYRRRIRATPHWDSYLTVAALLVAVAALPLGAKAVAGIAGIVWLVMTLRLCVARLRNTSKAPARIAEVLVTSALIPPLAVFWRAVGAFKFRIGLL